MNILSSCAVDSFYFDESVQDRHGFVLGAYVFTNRGVAEAAVTKVLRAGGFQPGIDEYKSRVRFDCSPGMRLCRDQLVDFVSRNTNVALIIVKREERDSFGEHALRGLAHLAWKNGLDGYELHGHFDQGLFPRRTGTALAEAIGFPDRYSFSFEADSRTVFGLQLADLVANAAARIIAEWMDGHPKTILLGEESGYQVGTPVSLSWSLKMMLRYSFFSGRLMEPPRDDDGKIMWHLPLNDLRSYCIYTTELPEPIENAVQAAFGTVWLGCIH
jgi:hypothetical protein